MKKSRQVLIVVFYLLIIISGISWFLLSSSIVSRLLIRKTFEQNFKDYQVQSLVLTQKFISPNRLFFEQLQLVLAPKADKSDLKPYTLKIDYLNVIWVSLNNIEVTARRINLESEDLKANDLSFEASVQLLKGKLNDIQGSLRLKELEARPFKVKYIVSAIKGDDKIVRLTNVRADVYEGKLTGEILLVYRPSFTYSMTMNIKDLNTQNLRGINETVFTQFEGIIEGEFVVKGTYGKVDSITSDFHIPQNGRIRAALLAFITQYLPARSRQKVDIETLLSMDGMLPVEVLSIDVKNISDEKLQVLGKIYSKQLNLEFNPTFDINFGTKISSLPEYWDKILTEISKYIKPAI